MRHGLKIMVISLFLTACARVPEHHFATLSMPSPPVTTNKIAWRIYQELPIYVEAAKLPWQPIDIQTPFKKSASNVHIPEIRQRLMALHDMPAIKDFSEDTRYDASLRSAIGQFQYQNDLEQTGIIDRETLDALNIPPSTHFSALIRAMDAWSRYPNDENSRYILVNIPNYRLYLIDHGNNALSMKVIVGKPSRPTPTLQSRITTLVFNPHWNVPETILAQDVIPGMQENPNYLKEHYDMHIYQTWNKDSPEVSPASIDWHTASVSNFKYRVTAPPSDINPLGRIKFIFDNTHDVYLHDTPAKSLFSMHNRAHSSGCIRVEDPMALVRYFYSDNSDLNELLVSQYLSTFETKHIALKTPMPIYVTYILVSVDANNQIRFLKNVYAG